MPLQLGVASEQPSARPRGEPLWAVCTIEDALAHTGLYVVRQPGGPLAYATDLQHAAAMPLGGRAITSYIPRSQVLVAFFPGLHTGVILGSLVQPMSANALILPDSMVLRSRAGICEDPMHYGPFSDPRASAGNRSAGRPADTLPGDWGYTNDLGLAFWIGRMMASLRASDGAKIEAFWGDDVLRLTGYNTEFFSAGVEERRVNDEGEYDEVFALTPFPWEGLGRRTLSTATRNANGALQPGSEYAKTEPAEDSQLMIPRQLRFRGYLGDLEREFLCAPPEALETETYEAQTIHHGLCESYKGSDGTYAVRSAKQLIFEKYALLPVPKKLADPEDPTGDTPENYKAADLQGDGPAYEMPEFVWGAEDSGIRAAQLFDYQAWLFNRYSCGGLAAHKKDWYYPDESALTAPVNVAVYDKSMELGFTFRMELPGYGELVIDERPGHSARYYKSRSCIQQLDDGSIVIEDGYGSQIRMEGGNIFLSCVGDVWLQPGRNVVAWAPHDAIIRAGNSVDVTASKHDVRIKAERNAHILAGNDGVGSLLLESRSQGVPTADDYAQTGEAVNGRGIVVKCPDSEIQLFGRRTYVGGTDALTLDAGEGTLYTRSAAMLNRITQLFSLMVADANGNPEQVLAINQSAAMVSAPLMVGGPLIVAPADGRQADVIIGGNLAVHEQLVAGGGIATNGSFAARRGAPFVGELDRDIELTPKPAALADTIENETERVGEITETEEALTVDDDNTSPGNADYRRRVGFSCRDTVRDLKLEQANFVLYEARWQQMLRNFGGGETWDEPVVTAPNNDATRPHPGQTAWTQWQANAVVASNNFSYADRRAKNRADMTQNGNAPDRSPLSSGYLINVQT